MGIILPNSLTVDPQTNLQPKPSLNEKYNSSWIPKLETKLTPRISPSPFVHQGLDVTKYEKYLGTLIPGTDFDELRAQNQGLGEKIGRSGRKMLTRIATSIAGSTVGLGVGVGNWVAGNGFSGFYDNDFQRFLDNANDTLREKFPHYYTKAEQEKSLLGQLATTNFWLDKVADGLAFSIGAVASELITAGLSNALLPAKILSFFKPLAYADDLARAEGQLQKLGILQKVFAGTNTLSALGRGAMYEAGVESRMAKDEMRDQLLAQYQQQHGQLPTGKELAEIEDYAESVGNTVFGLQTALIGFSQLKQFPKIFGKGWSGDVADLGKIIRETGGTYTAAFKQLSTGRKILSGVGTVLKNPFYEGVVEEGGQKVISETTKDFFNSVYDKDGQLVIEDLIAATVEGLSTTYGTKEGLEEVLIGAIVGAMGVPGAGGGIYGAFKEKAQTNKYTEQMVNLLNANPDLATAWQEHYKNAVRTVNIDAAQDKALMEGNVRQYKDLEADRLFSYMLTRIKAQRLGDFQDDLSALRKLAPEDFKKHMFGENSEEKVDAERQNTIINDIEQQVKTFEKNYAKVNRAFPSAPDSVKEAVVYDLHRIADIQKREKQLIQELNSGLLTDAEGKALGTEAAAILAEKERLNQKLLPAASEARRKRGTIKGQITKAQKKQVQLTEQREAQKNELSSIQAQLKAEQANLKTIQKRVDEAVVEKQEYDNAPADGLTHKDSKLKSKILKKIEKAKDELAKQEKTVKELEVKQNEAVNKEKSLEKELTKADAEVAKAEKEAQQLEEKIAADEELFQAVTWAENVELFEEEIAKLHKEGKIPDEKGALLQDLAVLNAQKKKFVDEYNKLQTKEGQEKFDKNTQAEAQEAAEALLEQALEEAEESQAQYKVQIQDKEGLYIVLDRFYDMDRWYYTIYPENGSPEDAITLPEDEIYDPYMGYRGQGTPLVDSVKEVIYHANELLKLFTHRNAQSNPKKKDARAAFVKMVAENKDWRSNIRFRAHKTFVRTNMQHVNDKSKLSTYTGRLETSGNFTNGQTSLNPAKQQALQNNQPVVAISAEYDLDVDLEFWDGQEWQSLGHPVNPDRYVLLDPVRNTAISFPFENLDMIKAHFRTQLNEELTDAEAESIRRNMKKLRAIRNYFQTQMESTTKDEFTIKMNDMGKDKVFVNTGKDRFVLLPPGEKRTRLSEHKDKHFKFNGKYYILDRYTNEFLGNAVWRELPEEVQHVPRPPVHQPVGVDPEKATVAGKYLALAQDTQGHWHWIAVKTDSPTEEQATSFIQTLQSGAQELLDNNLKYLSEAWTRINDELNNQIFIASPYEKVDIKLLTKEDKKTDKVESVELVIAYGNKSGTTKYLNLGEFSQFNSLQDIADAIKQVQDTNHAGFTTNFNLRQFRVAQKHDIKEETTTYAENMVIPLDPETPFIPSKPSFSISTDFLAKYGTSMSEIVLPPPPSLPTTPTKLDASQVKQGGVYDLIVAELPEGNMYFRGKVKEITDTHIILEQGAEMRLKDEALPETATFATTEAQVELADIQFALEVTPPPVAEPAPTTEAGAETPSSENPPAQQQDKAYWLKQKLNAMKTGDAAAQAEADAKLAELNKQQSDTSSAADEEFHLGTKYPDPKDQIDFEQSVAWLQNHLPAWISIRDIQSILHTLDVEGIPFGLLKDATIYLSKAAPKTTPFHEAFHAVFRLLFTAEEQARLLRYAARHYKPTAEQKAAFRKLAANRALLNDAQLTQLMLEEWLADRFADYQVKRTAPASFLKRLWQKLLDFVNWFTGQQDELERVAYKFYKGAYKSSPRINHNKGPIAYMLIPNGINPDTSAHTYESQQNSQRLVHSIAARINKALEGNHGTTVDERHYYWAAELRKIIAEEQEFFNTPANLAPYLDRVMAASEQATTPEAQTMILESGLRRIEQMKFIYNDTTALETLQEEVYSRLRLLKVDNNKEEEDDAVNSEHENERGMDYDRTPVNIGGVESMTNEMRNYFSFITYTAEDEFGRQVTMSIDVNQTYNMLTRALSGKTAEEMQTTLRNLAQWNPQIQAVWEQLQTDIGVEMQGQKLVLAPKDIDSTNAWKRFTKTFELERLDYSQTQLDPDNRFVKTYNAHHENESRYQFTRWHENYNMRREQILAERDRISALFGKAIEAYKAPHKDRRGDRKAIREAFAAIGIQLSEAFIDYSILYHTLELQKTRKGEDEYAYTPGDKGLGPQLTEWVESETVNPLTYDDLHIYQQLIQKGQSPFMDSQEGAIGRTIALGKANAVFDETVPTPNFRDGNGESRYPFIRPSYQVVQTRRLKQQGKKVMPEYAKKGNNPLLRIWDEVAANLATVFLGDVKQSRLVRDENGHLIEKYDPDFVQGATYKDLDDRTYLLDLYSKFLAMTPIKNGLRFAAFGTKIFEAKSTNYGTVLPIQEYWKDGMTDIFKRDIFDLFHQEYKRIGREWKDNSPKRRYTGVNEWNLDANGVPVSPIENQRAFTFWHFKHLLDAGLSFDLLQQARDGKQLTAAQKDEVLQALEAHMENEVLTHHMRLQETGILDAQKRPVLLPQLTDAKGEPLASTPRYSDGTAYTISDVIRQFVLNDYINSMSFNQLLEGDPAFRKSPLDAIKRNGGSAAFGPSMGTGVQKVAYLKDPQRRIVIPEAGIDTTVDSADGQTWTSLNHRRQELIELGRFNSKTAAIYDKIEAGEKLSTKDIDYLIRNQAFLGSLKTVYYDGQVYHKMSEHVLTKRLTSYKNSKGQWVPIKGREWLHDLREAMETHGIDQVVPPSASKTRNITPAETIADLGKTLPDSSELQHGEELPMMWKRLQVEVPSGKGKITLGTQLLQLIDSEQDNSYMVTIPGNSEPVPLGAVRAQFQDMISKTRGAAFVQAYKLLGDFKNNKFQKGDEKWLRRKMIRLLERSAASKTLIEFFQLDVNGEPIYNLNHPETLNKFEQLFLSHFNQNVLRQKIQGFKCTLVSDQGYKVHRDEKGNVIRHDDPRLANAKPEDATDLRWMKETEDGVSRAEVLLPHWVKSIMNLEPGAELTEKQLAILRMIGFRIPTQDKMSMVAFVVVDFLPPEYHNIVVAPAELVLMSGADFDIDTLYIVRKAFYESEGQTYIFGEEGDLKNGEYSDQAAFEEYIAYQRLYNDDVKDELQQQKDEDPEYGRLKEEIKFLKDALDNFSKENKEAIHRLKERLTARNKKLKEAEDAAKENQLAAAVKASGGIDTTLQLEVEEYRSRLTFVQTQQKDLLQAYKEDIDEIRKQLRELESRYIVSVMRSIGLPTTVEEYQLAKTKNKADFNRAKNQNKMVDMMDALLLNPGALKLINTPMVVEGGLIDQTGQMVSATIPDALPALRGTSSVNDKQLARKINMEGRVNIGAIAVATTTNSVLTKAKVHLAEEGPLPVLGGKAYNTFAELDEHDMRIERQDGNLVKVGNAVRRKGESMSEAVSAMTDNQKYNFSAKLNLSLANTGILGTMISLSVGLQRSLVFLNQPILRGLSKAVELANTRVKTAKERRENASSFDLANKYRSKLITFVTKVEKALESKKIDVKALKAQVVIKGLTNDEPLLAMLSQPIPDFNTNLGTLSEAALTDLYIVLTVQREVLDQYINFEAVNISTSNLNRLMSVNKGLGTSFEEGIDMIADALEHFEGEPAFSLAAAMKETSHIKENIELVSKLDEITKQYFIERADRFRMTMNMVYRHMKQKIKGGTRKARQRTSRSFLTYLTMHTVLRNMSSGLRDLVDSRRLYSSLSDNTYASAKLEMLKAHPELAENAFLRYIKPVLEEKHSGMDLLSAEYGVNQSSEFANKLQNSYLELFYHSNPQVRLFAREVIAYLIAKDNMTYKRNSFMNVLPPNIFKNVSRSLDMLQDAVTFQDPKLFTELFGKTFEGAAYDFTELHLRSSHNEDMVISLGTQKNYPLFETPMFYTDLEGNIVFDLLRDMPSFQEDPKAYKNELGNRLHTLNEIGAGTRDVKTAEGKRHGMNLPVVVRFENQLYRLDTMENLALHPLDAFGPKAVWKPVVGFTTSHMKPYHMSVQEMEELTQALSDAQPEPQQAPLPSQEPYQPFNDNAPPYDPFQDTGNQPPDPQQPALAAGTAGEVMEKAYQQKLGIDSNIKPGVEELFESNPELANEVYEALGFKQKIYNNYLGTPEVLRVEDGELYQFKTADGLVGGVLLSPTEFRIDGISAYEIGKGQGTKLFEGLINYLAAKGVTTLSTISAGEGAIRMHNKTVEKGLLTKVKEDGRTATFNINNQITPQQKQQAQELYSQYLDTIFPDSKVKDILYHGSPNTFEKFNKLVEGIISSTQAFVDHYFFTSSRQVAQEYIDQSTPRGEMYKGTEKVYSVLINAKNLKKIDFEGASWEGDFYEVRDLRRPNSRVKRFAYEQEAADYTKNNPNRYEITKKSISKLNTDYFSEQAKKEGYDSSVVENVQELSSIADTYAVFEPEQIHILGSKQDIKGFKNFVKPQANTPVQVSEEVSYINTPTGSTWTVSSGGTSLGQLSITQSGEAYLASAANKDDAIYAIITKLIEQNNCG